MLSNRKPEPPEPPWYESNLLWVPIAIILPAVASVKHDLRWLLYLAWPCFGYVIWQLAKKTREPRLIAVLGIVIAGGGLLWLGNWLRPESRDSKADAISSNASPANRAVSSVPSNIVPSLRQPNESGPAVATTVMPHKHAFNNGLFRSSASSAPAWEVPATQGKKPKTRKEKRSVRTDGTLRGDDNTVVGRVPYHSINGNGNTFVGATDANGNTIFNRGGTTIGNGAQAGPTGVAIGAHANAGGPGSHQAQITNNAPNGIAISGGNVSNPTVNNFAPPQRQIPKNIEDELIATLKRYPGEARLNSDSGDFEANTLTRQLFSIFESAGWRPIEIGTVMGGAALPPEIQVGYRGAAGTPGQRGSIPEDQPAARAVVQAFLEAGFGHVTIVPNPNQKANVLLINVGHNTETDVGQ